MYSKVNEYKYYKVKLYDLTDLQKQRILDLAKVCCFVYNWGIDFCKSYYNGHYGKVHYKTMSMYLAKELDENPKLAWILNCSQKHTRDAVLKDLEDAFKRYDNPALKTRFPRYKSLKAYRLRAPIRYNRISFKGENNRYIRLPGISDRYSGYIDAKDHGIPVGPYIKYENARIKFDGNDYWLSIAVKVKVPFEIPKPTGEGFGIDVGIRTSAVLSNGIEFERVDPHRLKVLCNRRDKLRSAIDRADKLNKKDRSSSHTGYADDDLYAGQPISKKQMKRVARHRKTCIQIHNLYNSHYHKISRQIADMRPAWIAIEHLEIRRIQKDNKHTSKHVHESRLYSLLSMIDYKCRELGTEVYVVPADFPSSKKCSRCGAINEVGQSKTYRCPYCGLVIDRDLNASYNLRDLGQSMWNESHND